MNILIAEDEEDIRNLLTLQLEQEGYTVLAGADGIVAYELFINNPVDLILLDVMMPRLDGFNLLRKIRETSNVPVLFVTARGEEMDKVLGLGLGADDYLVKPIGSGELIARVGALLRRSQEYSSLKPLKSKNLSAGGLRLDIDGCCVYKNDVPVELSAKEYLLLKHLMENPERVFTKKQLYREIWEEDIYYDDNTVMVHVSRLRNKLEEDSKNPDYIKTIRGIGYKFHLKY